MPLVVRMVDDAGPPEAQPALDEIIVGMGSGRTLAVVVAHPDDDAYGVAGTVALHAADPEFRFVLVHATDGSAGDIRDGYPATRETLGAIRRGECEAAWRAHGRLPDRMSGSTIRDGAVDQMPFSELVDRIAAILAEEEPDVVATVGPDGITAHPDHITVGAGLLEYRSHLHVMADDPIDIPRLRRIVSREWAVIAWPPRPASAAMLSDVFEGLG